ncbi:MAG: hypothetical protein AMJ70_03055 [Dehalococcoidia bacterium SG8_51_3]|nr:MAG: hypothetical protein AMJ70_03055 [Dehalococcoidia bacterium SG8_51_3]
MLYNMESIGEDIRHFRSVKGWLQEQLAREIGVSWNTVQRWESGKTKPSQLAMQKLKIWLSETRDKG